MKKHSRRLIVDLFVTSIVICLSIVLFAPGHAAAAANAAVELTGDSYAEIPNTPALQSESFAVSFWFKVHEMRSQTLVAKIDERGQVNGWQIHIDSSDGKTLRFESAPGDVGRLENDFRSLVTLDTWMHVSAVYDSDEDVARLYINGRLNDEQGDLRSMGGAVPGGKIHMGRNPGKTPFSGMIDELAIWNRDLTETEVRRYMRVRPPDGADGLVGYWRFDEGAGSVAEDRIHGNDANIVCEIGDPKWVNSSVPMGEGTAVVVNCDEDETIRFPGTNVEFTPASDVCRPYAVAQIDAMPNRIPAGMMETSFWVIEVFDGGDGAGDILFDLGMPTDPLVPEDEAHPEHLLLYQRGTNAKGPWMLTATASWASAPGRVMFENVNASGQFVIAKRDRDIALMVNEADAFAIASGLPIDPNELTIEAWIFNDDETSTGSMPDKNQRYITLEPEGVVLGHDGGTQPGQLLFQLRRSDVGAQGIRIDDALQPNRWHHVAGVWSGNGMALYLDGVLKDRVPFSGELAPLDGRIKISHITETMKGRIEEVRVWHRARTGEEIRSTLYRPLRGDESGLVAYWPFSGQPTAAVFDSSGAYRLRFYNVVEADPWMDSDVPIPLGTDSNGTWGEANVWVHGDAMPAAGDWVSVKNDITISDSNEIRNLDIQQDGSVTVEANEVLTVTDTAYGAGEMSGEGIIRLGGESETPCRVGGAFHNLEIDHPSGAVLYSDMRIDGRLELVEGDLDLNGYELFLEPDAVLIDSVQNALGGDSGRIASRQYVGPGDLSNGENIRGLGIEIETDKALGEVDITRGYEPLDNADMTSIRRYYDLRADNNADLDATIVFHYTDEELNNNAEKALTLFEWSGDAQKWTPLDGKVNTLYNTITVTNINRLGTYTAFSQFEDIAAELPTAGAPLSGACAAWGDHDQDGDFDLLLAGPGLSYAAIFENSGNAVFENTGKTLFDIGAAETGCALAWGDFDNDGRLDALLAGTEGTRIMRNKGENGFVDIGAKLPTLAAHIPANGVLPAYLNGDGYLDIVLSGGDYVGVFLNNGDGTFSENKEAGLPTVNSAVSPMHPAAADFDGDGDVDLLLAGEMASEIYFNDGNGGFAGNPYPLPYGLGETPYGVGAAADDYNNDAKPDIVVAGSDATRIYRNDSVGDTAAFSEIDVQLGPVGPEDANRHVAWGDFDNDDRPDILLAGEDVTRIYRNNEDETFSDMYAMLPGMVSGNSGGSAVWGDMDGDGDLDIVLAGDRFSRIYRNEWNGFDGAPSPPTRLTADSAGSGAVALSWQPPDGADLGLTFNIRIGRSSGGGELLSAMSATDGQRLVPQSGNAGNGYEMHIGDLPTGLYSWSVQSVDSAYAGSDFPPESYFRIDCLAPVVSESGNQVTVVFDPGCAAREFQPAEILSDHYSVSFSKSELGHQGDGKQELTNCGIEIYPGDLETAVKCDDEAVLDGTTYAYYATFTDLYGNQSEYGPVYAAIGSTEPISDLGRAVQLLQVLCGLPLTQAILTPPECPTPAKPGLATVICLLRKAGVLQ